MLLASTQKRGRFAGVCSIAACLAPSSMTQVYGQQVGLRHKAAACVSELYSGVLLRTLRVSPSSLMRSPAASNTAPLASRRKGAPPSSMYISGYLAAHVVYSLCGVTWAVAPSDTVPTITGVASVSCTAAVQALQRQDCSSASAREPRLGCCVLFYERITVR